MLIPNCPVCAGPLVLGTAGTVDRWACPAGCGIAITLTESHEHLQDDEVARLWQLARAGTPGPLPGPFGGPRMVRVELGWDDDEVPEGEPGDGPDVGTVTVDVALDDQFLWFDATGDGRSELDTLPADRPNAGPSPDQLAAEARIRAEFGAGLLAASAERDGAGLTEQMYRRLARNPATLRALDGIGRAVTTY